MGDIADMLIDQGFDQWMDDPNDQDYLGEDDNHYAHRREYHGLQPGASCPECGNMLELRTNGKNGSLFVGCTGFPSCRVNSGYRRLEARGKLIENKELTVEVTVKPCFNCRDCRFHAIYESDGLGFFATRDHKCLLFDTEIDEGPVEQCL